MASSGILLIDKAEGPSSAQVVQRVKKITGAKKIGHLGTLDPSASGLLLLGVDEGTKVADIFLGGPKSYHCLIALGSAMDTQDATGRVIETRPVPAISDTDLKNLEETFTGELEQIPPMFSALKKDGVRLYQLARQGIEVERKPRRIVISSLALRLLSATEIECDVTCSGGTYVRTLAHDIGAVLGCGAHLRELRRTACSHLKVEAAVTVDALAEMAARHQLPLMSLSDALRHLPHRVCDKRSVARLRMGQQEILTQLADANPGETLVRIVEPDETLVALAEWQAEGKFGRWQLARVFRAEQ
jgi:tRNA pseudouridine55 synthase